MQKSLYCPFFSSNLQFINSNSQVQCCCYCNDLDQSNQEDSVTGFICRVCGFRFNQMTDNMLCSQCSTKLCQYYCSQCRFSSNFAQLLNHCEQCGYCHRTNQICQKSQTCAYCFSTGDGLFNQLVQLSCSHTLCQSCIKQTQKQHGHGISCELFTKVKCFCREEPCSIQINRNLQFNTVEKLQDFLRSEIKFHSLSGLRYRFRCLSCCSEFTQLVNCNGQFCSTCNAFFPPEYFLMLQLDAESAVESTDFYNLQKDGEIFAQAIAAYPAVFEPAAKASRLGAEDLCRIYFGDYMHLGLALDELIRRDMHREHSAPDLRHLVRWLCMLF